MNDIVTVAVSFPQASLAQSSHASLPFLWLSLSAGSVELCYLRSRRLQLCPPQLWPTLFSLRSVLLVIAPSPIPTLVTSESFRLSKPTGKLPVLISDRVVRRSLDRRLDLLKYRLILLS